LNAVILLFLFFLLVKTLLESHTVFTFIILFFKFFSFAKATRTGPSSANDLLIIWVCIAAVIEDLLDTVCPKVIA
jgi:hypothetical protein